MAKLNEDIALPSLHDKHIMSMSENNAGATQYVDLRPVERNKSK
jgi:hypothetical protein